MSNKSQDGRRYTWILGDPDDRDQYLAEDDSAKPPIVDLRSKCPPVVDQGDVGSCTGNALAGAMGFLELTDMKAKSDPAVDFSSVSFQPFSRMFIYYCERDMEGDPGVDGGAQIRDGVKALASTGCCSEITWPYHTGDLLNAADTFTKPSAEAYAEAAKHRISKYLRVTGTSLNALKTCLSAGFPIVFGFTVYPSFESQATAATGLVHMPAHGERPVGGHAVLAVGYDDSLQALIVRNSWGEGWGDKGYFYMPYKYATNASLADDFWTLRK